MPAPNRAAAQSERGHGRDRGVGGVRGGRRRRGVADRSLCAKGLQKVGGVALGAPVRPQVKKKHILSFVFNRNPVRFVCLILPLPIIFFVRPVAA